MENHEQITEDLSSRDNDELLFMASMVRLILDERGVYYPSRESGTEKPNEKWVINNIRCSKRHSREL